MSKVKITVGLGSCGIASGADVIYKELKTYVEKNNIDATVCKTGCIGVCRFEPIVEVYKDNTRTTYINVKKEDIKRIIDEHVINDNIVTDIAIDSENHSILDLDFFKKQTRIALHNCGVIDPEDINDYINHDGYKALEKVITSMTRLEVINEIKTSKLRGRGGAGFPTGTKWSFGYNSDNKTKYVCCNADEGDPGAFMDRAILEGNPHTVIEAMIIAGYAIGARNGYIYVRAEYPLAVKRLTLAIKQAQEKGFLNKKLFNTDFSFNLDIRLGAGAFVCGEETALMASIEGKRGEPKVRPPFPTTKGLFDKPTVLNNVETYANICQILLKGTEWFTSYGTEKSGGTKVFALGGKINNTGLVEVPIGTTLKEILYDIGGGIPNNKTFKAAQTGGPSGGCIPSEHVDIKIDYETLTEIGSMMGSGGLIVMDEDTCMVDIARFFLDFTTEESCGKCVPCRIGTKRMDAILKRITEGKGKKEDIDKLIELGNHIKQTSFCGLGQSAPNPVLSTIKYYKDEYLAHIVDKKCPAHVCKDLYNYVIDKDKCIGCGLCKRNCPVNAITGNVKEPHEIDPNICIKCGTCLNNCRFKAIKKV